MLFPKPDEDKEGRRENDDILPKTSAQSVCETIWYEFEEGSSGKPETSQTHSQRRNLNLLLFL